MGDGQLYQAAVAGCNIWITSKTQKKGGSPHRMFIASFRLARGPRNAPQRLLLNKYLWQCIVSANWYCCLCHKHATTAIPFGTQLSLTLAFGESAKQYASPMQSISTLTPPFCCLGLHGRWSHKAITKSKCHRLAQDAWAPWPEALARWSDVSDGVG